MRHTAHTSEVDAPQVEQDAKDEVGDDMAATELGGQGEARQCERAGRCAGCTAQRARAPAGASWCAPRASGARGARGARKSGARPSRHHGAHFTATLYALLLKGVCPSRSCLHYLLCLSAPNVECGLDFVACFARRRVAGALAARVRRCARRRAAGRNQPGGRKSGRDAGARSSCVVVVASCFARGARASVRHAGRSPRHAGLLRARGAVRAAASRRSSCPGSVHARAATTP